MGDESQRQQQRSPAAVDCERCGKPVPPKTHPGGHPKRFCSNECRLKAKTQKTTQTRQRQQQRSPAAVGRKRRPLTDAANDAAWALRKDVERIERIFADDRFGAYEQQVAPLLRSHLSYTAQACHDLISRITPTQEG